VANVKMPALAAAAVSIVVVTASTPAVAIDCKDGYQLVQGNRLATPYCQDDLLTRVARQYGMKVNSEEIRESPNFKREVCRIVGRDIRVQENCRISNPSGRRGF
jgi:hypothetical protein